MGVTDLERSHERLIDDDLLRVARIARERLARVFADCPVARLYRDRLLLLALCQGAAQHYVDGRNGVKDLDVWAFFRDGPPKPFPYRTIWRADFGASHLGRHPADKGYAGRRIDVIGRSIPLRSRETQADAVRTWLKSGSSSADHLAKYPVIGLFPDTLLGRQIWVPGKAR